VTLAEVIYGPWAIRPEMLATIRDVYEAHARGEKADIPAIEAAIGKKLENNPPPTYALADGIATIAVNGVLAKRMNLFSEISGGTSTQMLRSQLAAAVADPVVRSIVLAIDSPGGTIDGTQQFADEVFAARGKKPLVAVIDGTGASAAYWIASAADAVFVSDQTTQVGSIGVVATHTDFSGAYDKAGIKKTEITAGKYKRIASEYAPLSVEGAAVIQEQLDQIYGVFVDSVARNRAVATEVALARMADGRVFLGQAAIEAGLADAVATMAQVRDRLKAGETKKSAPVARGTERKMTIEEIRESHPEMIAKIEADAVIAAAPALRAEGAASELARIKDVEAQSLPGHEALVASLKYDGKTTGPEAASQVLAAERAKRGDKLAALHADAAAAAVAKSTAAPEAKASGAHDARPIEDRAKEEWDASAETRAEFTSLETFTAFRRAQEARGIRLVSRAAA